MFQIKLLFFLLIGLFVCFKLNCVYCDTVVFIITVVCCCLLFVVVCCLLVFVVVVIVFVSVFACAVYFLILTAVVDLFG